MKDSITAICCACMLAAGVYVSKLNTTPTNTIQAANTDFSSFMQPIQVHDTITTSDTIRDTVPVIKYKTKYKTKRVPCTHSDTTVSNTVSSSREVRKGTPPDTLPSPARWYKVYGTVEPIFENRQYIPAPTLSGHIIGWREFIITSVRHITGPISLCRLV